MSRLSTHEVIAKGDYLEPEFQPNSLTIPVLNGVLSYHQVRVPASANKARLVDLFNAEIKANATILRRARLVRQETAASEDGIVDGISGLPLVSQNSTSVRRSSRRLSRAPSVEASPPEPPQPKRRRSSAAPVLGHGQPSSRRSAAVQPAVKEESEPEDDEPGLVRKVSRSKKDSEAAGSSARRVSQKFGPGTAESGWEDNNIFQSGGESSPARSPKPKTPRKSSARKARASLSAPPDFLSSPPQSPGFTAPVFSLPQSKFEPVLPPSVSTTPPRLNEPILIKDESDDDLDMYEENSGLADVSADVTMDVISEEGDGEPHDVEEVAEGAAEEDPDEDQQTADVSRRIAQGGAGALLRRPKSSPRSPVWYQLFLGLIALAFSGLVGQYKVTSAPIGYCETGRNTNRMLIEMERTRREIEVCHAEQTGDYNPDACPPLPLIPLPHPTTCTPCPAHAVCTRTTVICDDGFLHRPHLLSHIPGLSTVLDGFPGLGPIAFPPSCVEDPIRKRNIGVLGKAIDNRLALERGRRVCSGVDPTKTVDGGEARKWGLEKSVLRAQMLAMRNNSPVGNFDNLFEEALGQLSAYGQLLRGHDSMGKEHFATEHIEMDWNCRLIVAARGAWMEWRRSIFGTLFIILAGFYGKARMAVRRVENKRVANLVQIALDTLRNQEFAHHTDPVLATQPYLSSLQLRDVVLLDEHSIPTRQRLWDRVERIVEGNANVRVNLEELESGDEARVWRWVGGSGRVAFSGEGAQGRIVA